MWDTDGHTAAAFPWNLLAKSLPYCSVNFAKSGFVSGCGWSPKAVAVSRRNCSACTKKASRSSWGSAANASFASGSTVNTSRVPSSQHQSAACSGAHCRSWSAMVCSSCGVTLPDSHFHGRKSFPSGSGYSGWHSCISPEKRIPFCRQKQKYAASTCCRSFSSVPNRRHTFRSAVRAMPPSSRLHLHSSQLSVLPSSAEKPPETGCNRYEADRFSKYSIPN